MMEWLFWTIILSTSLYSQYSLYNVYTSLTLDTETNDTETRPHDRAFEYQLFFYFYVSPENKVVETEPIRKLSHPPDI